MIGLKAKPEHKNNLGYDVNLLPPLKLMPEAVLGSSSLCHRTLCLNMLCVPVMLCVLACCARHSSLLMFAYDTAKLNAFSNFIRVAV